VTASYALDWFRQALFTAMMVAGPTVLVVLVVGLLLAILQAATQVNDQAVAFGPKALAAVATLGAAGPWMLTQLSEFTVGILTALGTMGP